MTESRSNRAGSKPDLDHLKSANVSQSTAGEQRMAALKMANARRSAMRQLKADLATLSTMQARGVASEVIELMPHNLGAMKVEALLCAMQGWGPVKAHRVCRRVAVFPKSRLDELDTDERTGLIEILRKPGRV
jgi:hypothetical protein